MRRRYAHSHKGLTFSEAPSPIYWMTFRSTVPLVPMLPLLLAMACVAPDPGSSTLDTDPLDTSADTGTPYHEEVELSPTTTTQPDFGGLVRVSWEAGTAGESWVEYGLDGVLDQRTPSYDELHSVHEVVLLGLKLGREYDYRVCTLTDAGELLVSEVGIIDVPPPPSELIPAALQVHASQAHQGYVIVPQVSPGGTWITILDADGDYVWVWRGEPGATILELELHPDGHTLLYEQQHVDQEVDRGEVGELPLDGQGKIVHTRTYQGHHAFAQLPDGSFGRLSMEQQELEIDGKSHVVTGDRIIEVEHGNQDLSQYEVAFDFFEDYPVEPGPEILEEGEWVEGADWTHANSLAYLPAQGEEPDPQGGFYYLGARNLDTILKIDRRTSELVWQMGGDHSDFSMSPGTAWTHGHFSELWDDGVLLMDNGLGGDTSRVVEYHWDDVIHRVDAVWEYEHPDGLWISFLGDARRLPSDHVLVSWTSAGTLEEVSRDGEVLWQVQLDVGGTWGRVLWVPDLYDPLGLDG